MLRIFVLSSVTMVIGATTLFACPTENERPRASFTATASQFLEARDFSVIAGGNSAIRNCPDVAIERADAAGYFTQAPDFSFEMSDMDRYALRANVLSACETALLINVNASTWYYDETGDLAPAIELTDALNGRIDMWVGTMDGGNCGADLQVQVVAR